jgi:hypothetical protein
MPATQRRPVRRALPANRGVMAAVNAVDAANVAQLQTKAQQLTTQPVT